MLEKHFPNYIHSVAVVVTIVLTLIFIVLSLPSRHERDERIGRHKDGVKNPGFTGRNAATRGLPTAMAQSQISRDPKASARGAVIASARGDGAVATNGGMPSDYQVCMCEREEGWSEREMRERGRDRWVVGREKERGREGEGGRRKRRREREREMRGDGE